MSEERVTVGAWPRLCDVRTAAAYLSLGQSTIRDYVAAGILVPVPMPGSTLRDQAGEIIARPQVRRMVKLLFDRQDLDAFVLRMKESA